MGEKVSFQISETFESVGPCCTCGVTMVFPAHFVARRREDHAFWFCPNGHSRHFPGESELEKAKKLLETERRWREQEKASHASTKAQLERSDRSNAALRGEVTKVKNRVGNGVCPCCNRTFTNLQRHMHTKHPGFKDQTE